MENPTKVIRERGSAVLVVVVALLIFLPLALLVTLSAYRWKQTASESRHRLELRYAVRGAYHDTIHRLGNASTRMGPRSSRSREPTIGGYPIKVRTYRLDDVVITHDGKLLEGFERNVDLTQVRTDSHQRRFLLYRRCRVYLVEAKAADQLAGVRLHGVLIWPDRGELTPVGVQLDRIYSIDASGRSQHFWNPAQPPGDSTHNYTSMGRRPERGGK